MLRIFWNLDDARIVRRTKTRVAPNTHTVEDLNLGLISLTATEIPVGFPEVGTPLSDKEKGELEKKFFGPARMKLERRRFEELEQRLDPMRRMDALRSAIEEVAQLSHARPVNDALKELLANLLSVRSSNRLFPLEVLKCAYRNATRAAEAGEFGTRSDGESLKESPVAGLWSEVREERALLVQALQDKKHVRGGKD